ncbi:MAG: hypothetical protein KDC26_09075 [Armatimonadetes bacterium]|nr:hypothetical protein [Armatimonadota bacterium]
MTEIAWEKVIEGGAWAVVAVILIHQILRAWITDRQILHELLTGFRSAIEDLRDAINAMRSELGEKHKS